MAMTQRQKALSTLAVVASLAAALGSYAWFGVYKRGIAEKKATDAKNTLFGFKTADVKKVVVKVDEPNKQATTTIERDGKDWKITAPIQARAEDLSVNALVDKIAGLKRLRAIDGVTDLSEYGLTKPRIAITVTLASGGTDELDVGDDNPYDNTLFVKTAGGVSVCEGALKYPLDKDLFDLRDKRVFPFEDDAVSQLDVVGPKFSYSLARKSASDWSILAPIQEKADAQKAEQLSSSLRNLRATRFASEQASTDDLEHFGLNHPTYTANVTLGKDSAQKTLAIADVKEGGVEHVYVKSPTDAWIAEVPTSIVKDLDVTTMDLRDKTVLAFAEKDATGLSFAVGGKAFGVDRHREATDGGFAPDDWKIASGCPGAGRAAKRWKCASLLSTLQNLKGSSIVSERATSDELSGWGLSPPAKTVKVLGAGGKTLAELLVGKTDGGKIHVKSATSPRVFEVESYRLSQLPSDEVDLEEAPQANKAPVTAKR